MLTERTCRREGFTLIELMIVVAILGVLSSLAVPAFSTFVRRSRTATIAPTLQSIYVSASSYYVSELTGRGTDAVTVTNCISGPAMSAWTPSEDKHMWDPVTGDGFRTIGFTIADMIYFTYELDTFGLPSTCAMPSNNPTTYVFRARGDLDGDGILSTFEVAVGTDGDNALYRGAGMWTSNELE